jgi:hypothetical protein
MQKNSSMETADPGCSRTVNSTTIFKAHNEENSNKTAGEKNQNAYTVLHNLTSELNKVKSFILNLM